MSFEKQRDKLDKSYILIEIKMKYRLPLRPLVVSPLLLAAVTYILYMCQSVAKLEAILLQDFKSGQASQQPHLPNICAV